MVDTRLRCICRVRWRPGIGGGIISSASIRLAVWIDSGSATPNNHLRSGPYCCVVVTVSWLIDCTHQRPAVDRRIVSTAAGIGSSVVSTPDDHFAAGPHGCVKVSCRHTYRLARGHPVIKAGARCAGYRRQLIFRSLVCRHCSETWSFSIIAHWRSRISARGIHLKHRTTIWQRSNLSSKLLILRREISNQSLR